MTEWKLRKAIASLLEKNLIRREKLFARHQEQEYKSFWWQPKNQTYYYSINYQELEKLIEKAETTENARIENFTELSIEETKETKFCELSQNSTKKTNYKDQTTKQPKSDRNRQKLDLVAAASPKMARDKGNTQSNTNNHSNELIASPSQIKPESTQNKSNSDEETKIVEVDYIINKDWKALIPLLDSVGVP